MFAPDLYDFSGVVNERIARGEARSRILAALATEVPEKDSPLPAVRQFRIVHTVDQAASAVEIATR